MLDRVLNLGLTFCSRLSDVCLYTGDHKTEVDMTHSKQVIHDLYHRARKCGLIQ